LRFLEDITDRAGVWLAALGGVTLVSMMLLIVVNMFLRQISRPFGATVEVVAWLSATTISLSLAYSQMKKAHISIDMVTGRFPRRVRLVIRSLMLLVGAGLFSLGAYRLVLYALNLRDIGTVSNTLLWPFWPMVLVAALGVAFFVWRLLLDIAGGLDKGWSHE
jgi:TRAP-type C4-dicarboxylate transport system permease small subunit